MGIRDTGPLSDSDADKSKTGDREARTVEFELALLDDLVPLGVRRLDCEADNAGAAGVCTAGVSAVSWSNRPSRIDRATGAEFDAERLAAARADSTDRGTGRFGLTREPEGRSELIPLPKLGGSDSGVPAGTSRQCGAGTFERLDELAVRGPVMLFGGGLGNPELSSDFSASSLPPKTEPVMLRSCWTNPPRNIAGGSSPSADAKTTPRFE